METVIAIPIFLVLIGGTLWLGDLNLARQRLLVADRYAAWNEGNRHGGASATEFDIWKKLFNKESDQDIKKIKIKAKSSGWYTQVSAMTRAKITMPDWTHGMINAGVTWDAPLDVRISKSETMTGRDGSHLIAMRGGSRTEDLDKINWISVRFAGFWPAMGGKKKGGGGGGKSDKFAIAKEYKRFGTFVDWSD